MSAGKNGSPVNIRRATSTDASALARLRYDFRAELTEAVEDEQSFLARCEGWMRRELDESMWQCWLAEREHDLIGALWLYLIPKLPNPNGNPETHAYLSSFVVRESHRGAGIGSRLLDEAIRWCESKNVDEIVLWPTDRSRPLYLRNGFRVATGILDRPVHGHK